MHQVESLESADELVRRLAAHAERAGQGCGRDALGGQVGKDQRLGGVEPRPAVGLEPVEELAVEPTARSKQQISQRWLGHLANLSPAA